MKRISVPQPGLLGEKAINENEGYQLIVSVPKSGLLGEKARASKF